MMAVEGLQQRLAELVRRRGVETRRSMAGAAGDDADGVASSRAQAAAVPPVAPPARECERLTLEEVFPGGELTTAAGPVYLHQLFYDGRQPGAERMLALLRSAIADLELVPADEIGAEFAAVRDHGLDGCLFLDLETGGLAGQPVFLAGLLRVEAAGMRLEQILVRSHAEEAALVAAVREALAAAPVLVTYNGKSFDLPQLVDRASYHGQLLDHTGVHLDLLHPARRRYRGRLPDCRLTTLEWYVCHRRRWGDVPGDQIPGRFFAYLQDGDPAPLVPVLHHNALDLITLAELCGHLAPVPPGQRFVPDTLEMMGT